MTLECTKCRLAWIPRHTGEATCPRCASQADVAALSVKVAELQTRNENIHAAKEVLVSDVTRLAAELAESARALAVSQGEVERLRGELGSVRLELRRLALLPRLRQIMALLAPPPAPPAKETPTVKMIDGFPRRNRLDHNVPAELAIRAAIDAVETLGADPRQTRAVVLLCEALDSVSDYIDDQPTTRASPEVTVKETSK